MLKKKRELFSRGQRGKTISINSNQKVVEHLPSLTSEGREQKRRSAHSLADEVLFGQTSIGKNMGKVSGFGYFAPGPGGENVSRGEEERPSAGIGKTLGK